MENFIYDISAVVVDYIQVADSSYSAPNLDNILGNYYLEDHVIATATTDCYDTQVSFSFVFDKRNKHSTRYENYNMAPELQSR